MLTPANLLRRLRHVNSEAHMIAAGPNLKRLLKKRGWGRRPFPVEAICASFWVLLCGVLVLACDYSEIVIEYPVN